MSGRLGFKSLLRKTLLVWRDVDKVLVNQGEILSKLNSEKCFSNLSDAGFRVYSQWEEDGIIQHIVENVELTDKTFIEFGVETFEEANCRFLMVKDNWSGFVIDGSRKNIGKIRSQDIYWKCDLQAECAFITRDNIEDLLSRSGFGFEPGILSVDIDGNDYFVLKQLYSYKPTIIIVEYNGLFGNERAVSVPYDPSFVRTQKHFSNVYWGASLAAFDDVLQLRGYALVGTNKVGSNAFFVRRDRMSGSLREVRPSETTPVVTFREARNERGELVFADNRQSAAMIAHLPLIDVRSGREIKVGELELE